MNFAYDPDLKFYYMGDDTPGPGLFTRHFIDSTPPVIYVDAETVSVSNRLALGIGIATSLTDAFYFPLFPEPSPILPWHILQNKNIAHVYHNGLFDLDAMLGYDIVRDIHDTAIMSRLQGYKFNDLVSLSFLHKRPVRHMGDVLKEHNAKNVLEMPEEATAYKCCQDVLATGPLFHALLPGTDLAYYNVERATIPIMLDMTYRGILLDQEERQRIEESLEIEIARLEELCQEEEMFNPGSPQQVSFVLAKLGAYSVFPRLPFTRDKYSHKSTGKLSSESKYLKQMEHPLAKHILDFRLYRGLLTRYIRPWKDHERAMTKYHLDAITGRPSSTSGQDLSNYRNMQNIPGKYAKDGTEYAFNCRSCLLPDSGMWTDMDFEQAEIRSIAYLSGDREMARIYSQPKLLEDGSKNPEADIHQQVADFIGIKRKLAKTVNFAMTYGATIETLREQTGIKDRHHIEELKRMWYGKFPEAGDWIDSRQEDAMRTGYAYSALGRKMRLPSLDEDTRDGITRKAINWPCQSTAADLLKRALIICHNKGMDIALQVHDELLIDGYHDTHEFDELASIMPFTTPFDVKWGERWGM